MPAPPFNPAPTNADLPDGHPFRNPIILAALQVVFPKWKSMTDAEYLAKPYLHPANIVGVYGLKEIFPPYHFLPQEFPGGTADWGKIDWPSHAYSNPRIKCCELQLAVLQFKGINEGALMLGECFGCQLEKKGEKIAFCCSFGRH